MVQNYLIWLLFPANILREMVRFVEKGAGVLKDVSDILMPVLKKYALSVMRKHKPRLESVSHIKEFIKMPGVKVKKLKWNQT